MVRKILKTLSNNIGFKILAVFLAFVLWVVVYNTDDPEKTRQFSVSVTITNEESLTNKNLCYEIIKNTNNVTFSVTAKRSNLNNLDDRSFTATADMSSIVIDQNDMTATVPITITCKGYSDNTVRISREERNLQLKLENLMVKQFPVVATTTGSVAKGYTLGEVTVPSQNVLKVSGPESVVSKIASVQAIVDVDGMSQQINDNVVPTLLAEDGSIINATRLKLSSTTVPVKVSILNTKDITLNIITSGEPAANYYVTSVTSDPSHVTVKGSASALNAISSIDISSDALTITKDKTSDIETTVDITEFLPEGVSLINNEDAIVNITIVIEEYQTKTFSLATSDITVKGLDSAYKLEFLSNTVSVKVSALESNISSLKSSAFKASIDASELTAGTKEVKVNIGLSEEDYVCDAVTVSVRVSKKTDGSGTGGTTDPDPDEDETTTEDDN